MITGEKTRGTTKKSKTTTPREKPPANMRTRGRLIAEGVSHGPENTTKATATATLSLPEHGPFVSKAILRRVTDMGLITSATKQVGARLPTRLLERAKERTGLTSNTDLIVFALANIAVEDNFAKAFARARGTVDADLEF